MRDVYYFDDEMSDLDYYEHEGHFIPVVNQVNPEILQHEVVSQEPELVEDTGFQDSTSVAILHQLYQIGFAFHDVNEGSLMFPVDIYFEQRALFQCIKFLKSRDFNSRYGEFGQAIINMISLLQGRLKTMGMMLHAYINFEERLPYILECDLSDEFMKNAGPSYSLISCDARTLISFQFYPVPTFTNGLQESVEFTSCCEVIRRIAMEATSFNYLDRRCHKLLCDTLQVFNDFMTVFGMELPPIAASRLSHRLLRNYEVPSYYIAADDVVFSVIFNYLWGKTVIDSYL